MEIPVVVSCILSVLTLLYLAIVANFIRGWNKVECYVDTEKKLSTKVTVIVAARNEERIIAKTLDDLVAQSYDKDLTEIIFINDHSTDRTSDIISLYTNHGVKLINLNEDKPLNSYKKKAIQTAIAKASGSLIVTTDADCRMGSEWIKTIVSFYETGKFKMISSPVVYFEEKSFFERAQALEFLYLIGLGAATIGNKKPATCNGANLAYEKEAFYEVGGFKGIDDLASGDDELLLHKMAKAYGNKIGFLKNTKAIVHTHAKPSLGAFIQQRKRWSSKSTRYKNKFIIALGVLIWLFNLSIVANICMGFIHHFYLYIAFLQLLAKILIELLFLIGITGFARRRKLLLLLPVVSVLHVVYIIYIGIAGNSGKYKWKGRMVR